MKQYFYMDSMFFCFKKTVLAAVSLLLCSVCSLSAADNPSPANNRAAWIRSMNEQVRAKARSDASEAAAWERANHGVYKGGSAYDALRGALYFQEKASEAARRGDERSAGYYTMLADESFEIAQSNLERSRREGNTYDIEMYNQLFREQEPSSSKFPVFIPIAILSAVGCGVFYYVRRKKVSRRKKRRIKKIDGNNFDAFPQYDESTTPGVPLPNTPTDKFYICKPGFDQEGPYPEEMVRSCYEQGIFPVDTLIWFDGAAEWMPIQSVFATSGQASSMSSAPETSVPAPPSPPQEEAVYYVAQPGMQPQGPYTKSTVLADYYKGTYPAGSMVWGPDTGTWIPIENLLGSALHSGVKSAVGHFQGRANAKSWNPITAFVSCMKRYAQFSGRASRSEYWFFQLAWFILYIPIVIAKAVLAECDAEGVGVLLELIFRFATLVPMVAVAARRCHDTGRSGWFMLIPIYGWVLFFLPSKNENNPYGTSPLRPI